ncbi:MAG: TRAP transporter substrate-binding protein [Clostridiales bacterium]|nr:TRAP transporter substrate-binding protein [Clostridiales bacterium]
MKKFRKIAAVTAAALASVSLLSACGGSSSSSSTTTTAAAAAAETEAAAEGEQSGGDGAAAEVEQIDLVFAHINAETHTWHKMAEKFKELIEEKSGGNITVTIYPNNQLGSEIETIQSAIAGMGDCDIVLTGESMQTYAEELGIIGMPYAITSDEHMDAVLEGEVGQELEDLMQSAGLKVLGAIKRGPREITSNKVINSPDDLQGFIIRTPESKMTMAAFEAMGAKPTPMAFSEIFTSLQQGVIHGQENPLANIYDASLYEVQDYVIQTDHLRAWVYFAISDARFSSFSEAAQQMIQECATEAIAYEHELFLEEEAQLQSTLEEKGMTFIEVDQEPFKEKAVEGVLAVLSDKQKEIYEKMVAADPAAN